VCITALLDRSGRLEMRNFASTILSGPVVGVPKTKVVNTFVIWFR
jgi:hypothetical protein